MKFGKLNDISQVDFTLPADAPQTDRVLAKVANTGAFELYFGCPAWGCKEWIGKIYPPKTPASKFLYHYARQFNTIELNTTHYRIPTASMISQWKEAVPRNFRFCPKIPQSISHRRNLLEGQDLLTEFCASIANLEDNLGISFMQLPPHFTVNRAAELIHFLKGFPQEIPLSVEFRHESWFEGGTAVEQVFEAMESLGISAVITDVAGRRDVLHQRLTTPNLVLRLVGNSLDPTDYKRVDDWLERVGQWREKGLKEAYFFLHQPDDVLCPEYAVYFVDQANTGLSLNLKGPEIGNQYVQGSLF